MQLDHEETQILSTLAEVSREVFRLYNDSEFRNESVPDNANSCSVVAASLHANTFTAAPEALSRTEAINGFATSVEVANMKFSTVFEETMQELAFSEQDQVILSDLTVKQWNSLVAWILQVVDCTDLSLTFVPFALNIADRYFKSIRCDPNSDIIGVACASLFHATKTTFETLPLIKRLSALSNRPPQIIIDIEKTIVDSLQLDFVDVTPDEYIYMMNQEVFELLYSPLELQSKNLLVEILLRKAYFDRNLSHFLPSSIAFGCVLTIMGILDPCGLKRCNTLDVLSLARRHNLSIAEIGQCVEAFVEFLNET